MDSTPGGPDPPEYAFVTGARSSDARSHAMRMHWRSKHRRSSKDAKQPKHPQRSLAPLKPFAFAHSTAAGSRASDETLRESTSRDAGAELRAQADGLVVDYDRPRRGSSEPMQYVGPSLLPAAATLPDPFQSCPVRLTTEHQKLLHHCRPTAFRRR